MHTGATMGGCSTMERTGSRPAPITSPDTTARTTPTWVDDWAPLALCRTAEPDALFVQGAAQQQAKQICQRCPVIAECLADALDSRTEFGVWGGRTERERRAMLRRYPHITSWRAIFEADRAAQGAATRQTA